jgi:hypothetical protein
MTQRWDKLSQTDKTGQLASKPSKNLLFDETFIVSMLKILLLLNVFLKVGGGKTQFCPHFSK